MTSFYTVATVQLWFVLCLCYQALSPRIYMFTINYKGFYIHCDKSVCRINSSMREYKSMHAAKCHITRVMIPAHDAAMNQFSDSIK